MIVLQLSCLAIVTLFIVARARADERPAELVLRYGLIVAAAWVAEDTVISAYGFYRYSAGWTAHIHHVPIAIVMIWPAVIISARDLARCLLGDEASLARRALLAGAIVFVDAWLIEPIAVHSGLWRWSEPGLFAVPPIGVLGWAYFAVLAVAILDNDALGRWRYPLLVLLAPALVHLPLLATWWGALRWVNAPLPTWPVVALAWVVGALLAVRALVRRTRHKVPLGSMLLRVPAAALFFVLLGLPPLGELATDRGDGVALVVYAIAFAPPYLALTAFDARRQKT